MEGFLTYTSMAMLTDSNIDVLAIFFWDFACSVFWLPSITHSAMMEHGIPLLNSQLVQVVLNGDLMGSQMFCARPGIAGLVHLIFNDFGLPAIKSCH